MPCIACSAPLAANAHALPRLGRTVHSSLGLLSRFSQYRRNSQAGSQQGLRAQPGACRAMSVAQAPSAAPATQFESYQACIPGFLSWIARCNDGEALAHQFVPLTVAGKAVGYLKPDFAAELARFPDVFQQQQQQADGSGSSSSGGSSGHPLGSVAIAPSLTTPQQRSQAVAAALEVLRSEGKIEGWRNELYPVVGTFHEDPAFLVERAAAAHLGIKAYGIHMNGFVMLPDGSHELWVARRSKAKPTWPGKLDHIVAGGQPHGLSCSENVVKECEEEASIPAELAQRARPVGAVSYTSLQSTGLKRDVLYCYDLELPLDFVPKPQDGEVEEFMRLPLSQVASIIAAGPDASGDAFKDNCNLVIIDFLVRRGCLTPDMRGYCQLLAGLRAGDCS